MSERRRLTATILLTDVAGSTAQRVRLGEERADELRRRHDGLLTAAVEAAHGRVVKGSGDGVLALFRSASDALDAAVAAQRSLARSNAEQPTEEHLAVRMGLAVGDVSMEAGDCFGTPVVEAARLEAAAAPGQILCSDAVRAMARGRGDHRFERIGDLQLKGLPDPVPTLAVHWHALPSEEAAVPPEVAVEAARAFVGRREQLGRLVQLDFAETSAGITVAWLHGEPGAGKTSLAARAAVAVAEHGVRVLFGRCSEGLAVPYQPFVDALRASMRGTEGAVQLAALGRDGDRLSRLLPELVGAPRPSGEPVGSDRRADEYHLFEAVRRWLGSLCGSGPVVFVIDDLHWAERSTCALLEHLARAAEPMRCTVLCTVRDTAPDVHEHVQSLREALRRHHRLVEIPVTGLSVAEVTELVGDPATAARLHDRSGGNPLLVHALRAGGRDLVETVRHRVSRLQDAARELVDLAAVAGEEFELQVVAAAADLNPREALDRLEHCVEAGLLREVGAGRFRFAHALVRDALTDRLGETRRCAAHHALALAHERLGSAGQVDAALVVHHEGAAGPLGEPARLVRFASIAGAQAATAFAFDRAAAMLAIVAEHAGSVAARVAALTEQGEHLVRAAAFSAAHAAFADACDLADGHQLAELHARAAIGMEESVWRPGLPADPAITQLRKALSGRDGLPHPLVARLLASSARGHAYVGRRDLAVPLAEEAVELARTCDDDGALGHALVCHIISLGDGPESELVEALAEELLQAARRIGDEYLLLQGANFSLSALHRHSRASFDAHTARIVELADRRRDVVYRHLGYAHAIYRALGDGAFDQAEALIERAAADDEGWSEPDGVYGLRMFLLRREQDRLPELAPTLRLLHRLNPEASMWDPGLVLLHIELGQLEEARAVFDRVAARDFERVPHDGNRLLALCFLAEAGCALADVARARWLTEQLEPYRGQVPMVWGSGLCVGPADRLLGRLHATIGDLHRARTTLEAAVATSRFIGTPLWEAHSLCALGAATADRDALAAAGRLAAAHDLPAVRRAVQAALETC